MRHTEDELARLVDGIKARKTVKTVRINPDGTRTVRIVPTGPRRRPVLTRPLMRQINRAFAELQGP